MKVREVFILLVLSTHLPGALASEWKMEPEYSALKYIATYEGLEAPGSFGQFDVQLQFDPKSLEDGQLNVTIDLASADMGSQDINDAIVQKEWLHVMQFPRATFKSNNITKKSTNNYIAHGMLSLKGNARAIDVPFTWNETGSSARMQGNLVVKRTNFDIGMGEWADGNTIGTDVRVNFTVELKRAE